MQSIAVFTAPAEGAVSINGRFAGEAGPGRPLIMPVTPEGVLYIHFMPFVRRLRHCAYRVRIRGGRFELLNAGDMCRVVEWPGGIYEFELLPPAAYPPESEFGTIDGRDAALLRGERAMLRVDGMTMALPEGAQMPDIHIEISGADVYMGKCREGRYAAVYGDAPLECISAREIEIAENGLLRCVTALEDTVGHGVIEEWRVSGEGVERIGGEYMWAKGAPEWPDSPEKTVIAAVEAAMLGLDGEAAGYFVAGLPEKLLLAEYDAAVPMKYVPQMGGAAVALIKKVSEYAAKVVPLYYKAIPGGKQGGWMIERIWI